MGIASRQNYHKNGEIGEQKREKVPPPAGQFVHIQNSSSRYIDNIKTLAEDCCLASEMTRSPHTLALR